MDKEKQAEQLLGMIKELNKHNATSDDVTKIFGKTLEAIKIVKEKLEEKIATNHGDISDTTQTLLNELNALKDKVDSLTTEIPQTKEKMTGDMNKVVQQIYKEVKRIEQLIPSIPNIDLKPLEQRITKIESVKVPEVTGEKVRDALEALKGDARLEAEAINNLPKFTVSRDAPDNPAIGDIWLNLP